MTGDELKALRQCAGLSRPALAALAELHPDSIKYWERKAKVDLRGWAADRILRALGFAHLSQKGVFPCREPKQEWGNYLISMRARDGVLVGSRESTLQQPCGARTRKGHPCRAMAINGKGRCKFHGGMSTGPKTSTGRARIAEAQRKRWAKARVFP